jgi:GNAT superfamily N-acetyltransferase
MVLLGPPRRLRSHPDLVIERVGTAEGMNVYCRLVSELFGLPLTETTHLFPVGQLQNDAIRHYLGYLDDVPVVTGTGVLAKGIVSVWNVATHDVVRRHRVATALMERLLGDAWDDGCDASLLYSTPMAYSLYQKLGYELHTQRRCFLPPEW